MHTYEEESLLRPIKDSRLYVALKISLSQPEPDDLINSERKSRPELGGGTWELVLILSWNGIINEFP